MDDQGTPPRAVDSGMPLKRKARMYELLAEHEELHAAGKHHTKDKARELHTLIAEHPSSEYMVLSGRIPANSAEHAAVDKLQAANEGAPISLTRRDPGEKGPLLVHVGDTVYLITAAGKTSKQKKKA